MDRFKLLIRLLTKQGWRSDIAFDFHAESESGALEAAVRACLERADMNATSGGISQLDISLCDCRSKALWEMRIRPEGTQATFDHHCRLGSESDDQCLHYFALQPEDGEMFHLAAHGLLEQRGAHPVTEFASLR